MTAVPTIAIVTYLRALADELEERAANARAVAGRLEIDIRRAGRRRSFTPTNPHMAEAQQAMDTFRAKFPADPPCTRPPPGWKCTRRAHADGPCAALPDTAPLRKPSSGRKRTY